MIKRLRKVLLCTLAISVGLTVVLALGSCDSDEDEQDDCNVTFEDTIKHGRSLMSKSTEVEETTREDSTSVDDEYYDVVTAEEECPICGRSNTISITEHYRRNFTDPLADEYVTDWTLIEAYGIQTCSCGNAYHYSMGYTGGDAWWDEYPDEEVDTKGGYYCEICEQWYYYSDLLGTDEAGHGYNTWLGKCPDCGGYIWYKSYVNGDGEICHN